MRQEFNSSNRARFFQSVEGTIFVTGCVMLILWIAVIAFFWNRESAYWLKILTNGFSHLIAGRAASIAHGTSVGFHPALTAFLASYIDILMMCLSYPILVYSYQNFLERRFFKEHMQPVFDNAKKRLTKFRKMKILGVFIFVWFPFWMTGIICGAILGFLLGLRTWVNMATVILGSTSAVICWVYAYNKLFGTLDSMHSRTPFVLTILIIILLAILRIISEKRKNNSKHDSEHSAEEK